MYNLHLKVSDFVNEGTPVPIPNTVVKLIYVDNTWLEAAREDRSSLTLKTVSCNPALQLIVNKTSNGPLAQLVRATGS